MSTPNNQFEEKLIHGLSVPASVAQEIEQTLPGLRTAPQFAQGQGRCWKSPATTTSCPSRSSIPWAIQPTTSDASAVSISLAFGCGPIFTKTSQRT